MTFASVQFLFAFFPLALLAGLCLPRAVRGAALAAFSVLFCLWSGARGTLLLAAMALLNWGAGLLLAARRGRRGQGALLAGAVVLDLAPLCLCKCAALFAAAGALPLGVSFYTFQAIGYCVDVYRGAAAPERSFLRFFLFLGFFAHLPSGPILRYGDQAFALAAPGARPGAVRFCYGVKRFILGFAKKTLLADQLGLLFASVTAAPAAEMPGAVLWLGYGAFMLQLYYDFSGYSDMAVGLGVLFGLPVPENFDLPYLSRSVGEFWRRWHITLGAWFRDYVYIPLGGSRRGTARTCLNLLAVFLLTGLWHGAAWQFIAFGLVHGAVRCAERLAGPRLQKCPAWLGRVYTLATVFVGWVFFGAPGFGEALAALRGMLCWQAGAPGMALAAFAQPRLLCALAAGIVLCGPAQALCPRLKAALRSEETPGIAQMAVLFGLLLLGIMRVSAGNYSGFIYARF